MEREYRIVEVGWRRLKICVDCYASSIRKWNDEYADDTRDSKTIIDEYENKYMKNLPPYFAGNILKFKILCAEECSHFDNNL